MRINSTTSQAVHEKPAPRKEEVSKDSLPELKETLKAQESDLNKILGTFNSKFNAINPLVSATTGKGANLDLSA